MTVPSSTPGGLRGDHHKSQGSEYPAVIIPIMARTTQTRMSIASAIFEAGQVHFPERASWLPELEAELFSFPGGRHDDQVDSISQALNHGKLSSLRVWRQLGQL